MDAATLDALRRFDDPVGGISEEFLATPLDPSGGLAILARPAGDQRPLGFVICRPPGPERGPFRRLDALVSRTLAAAGFPTLRIRRGLDDEGVPADVRLSTAAAEGESAVRLVRAETGVERVGVLGALGGGAVAAIVAGGLELDALGLWEPVSKGNAYARRLLMTGAATDLAAASRGAAGVPAEGGGTMVRGLRLTDEGIAELRAFDLVRETAGFRGDALVVGLTHAEGEHTEMSAVVDGLRAAGGRVRFEPVVDSLTVPFGEVHLRRIDLSGKKDLRLDLDRRIAALTAAWAAELVA
jgi:hypothetical protein